MNDREALAERYRMAVAEIPGHHITDIWPDSRSEGMVISGTCPDVCARCREVVLQAKRLVEPTRPVINPELWGGAA